MTSRRRRWLTPALWVAVPIVVLVGVAALLTWRQNQQQQAAAQQNRAAQVRIDKLEATVSALASALNTEQAAKIAGGGQPVSPPAEALVQSPSATIPALTPTPTVTAKDGRDGRDGKDGAPGTQGPPPSSEQVLAAVTTYLIAHPPEGGKLPTAEQVSAAVNMFCATSACRGADGTDGATGATGPPPSDDQVAGAVGAFCAAHGGCVGATGAAGATGPAGFPAAIILPAAPLLPCTATDPDGDHVYECEPLLPPP